jgi:hypothetical protein
MSSSEPVCSIVFWFGTIGGNSILKTCTTVSKLDTIVLLSLSKSNDELFDEYSLQIVSAMLLYERIKLSSKSLYLTAIKKEIYKYKDVLVSQYAQLFFGLAQLVETQF